jgi:ribosomal protein L7/L12
MNTYIIIGIGLGILLFLIFKKSIFRSEKSIEPEKIADLNSIINDEKLKRVVAVFIKQNKKIEGIKYVRETNNVSLQDAKSIVEKIELSINSGNENFKGTEENVYSDYTEDQELVNKVKALIGSGNKITAIKLIAEEQKKGLAEAKDYVEKIESEIKKL